MKKITNANIYGFQCTLMQFYIFVFSHPLNPNFSVREAKFYFKDITLNASQSCQFWQLWDYGSCHMEIGHDWFDSVKRSETDIEKLERQEKNVQIILNCEQFDVIMANFLLNNFQLASKWNVFNFFQLQFILYTFESISWIFSWI